MLIIIYSCCWRWGEGNAKAEGCGYIRRIGRDRDGEWKEEEDQGLIENSMSKKIGNGQVRGRQHF